VLWLDASITTQSCTHHWHRCIEARERRPGHQLRSPEPAVPAGVPDDQGCGAVGDRAVGGVIRHNSCGGFTVGCTVLQEQERPGWRRRWASLLHSSSACSQPDEHSSLRCACSGRALALGRAKHQPALHRGSRSCGCRPPTDWNHMVRFCPSSRVMRAVGACRRAAQCRRRGLLEGAERRRGAVQGAGGEEGTLP